MRLLRPVVVVLAGVGAVPSGRMAAGGYRAKKRVSRGGRAVASLTYCRELMVVLVSSCYIKVDADVVKSIFNLGSLTKNFSFQRRSSKPRFPALR